MDIRPGESTSEKPVVEEPTVLDYVKSRLAFWRPSHLSLSDPAGEPQSAIETVQPVEQNLPPPLAQDQPPPELLPGRFPWVALAALALALIAQLTLEPPERLKWVGAGLYLVTALLVVWAYRRGDWLPGEPPGDGQPRTGRQAVFFIPLVFSVLLAFLAFFLFGPGTFSVMNVAIWLGAIGAFFMAFWEARRAEQSAAPGQNWLRGLFEGGRPTRWAVVLLVAAALVLFFRLFQLNQVPPEMVSDHAEKLLDVSDVLNGQLNIFFPRNTGREAFQFYLTAVVSKLFGTGLSFLSLKIGTVLAGLVTLVYIYLLGKEVGNRWVGLLAFVMCGVAYWPNIISRIGLRFPLYPLFAAPALFYLMRGLRRSSRNDLLLAGLAVGLGLHGYTSFRIVPFVVVAAVAIYALHRQSNGQRLQALLNLVLLAAVALLVFLPLFRYALSYPDAFVYRTFTRLGSLEQPLPGPAGVIFLQNLWNALVMFFWSDGDVWVHSIPQRPALDVISAALFFCGLLWVGLRYLRQRRWQDLFLFVSIPLLLLPSILSLAFPGENPSLNRTAAAYIPVFLIVAIAMEGLLSGLARRLGGGLGKTAAWAVGLALFMLSAGQNFDLVFTQYKDLYTRSAMNTSEAGQVMRDFIDVMGQSETTWVVAYPYWLDTRLVGINAGLPLRDTAIWPKDIPITSADPRTKLFILNMQDSEGLAELKQVYPQGQLTQYSSRVETKDFYLYLVPGDDTLVP